MPYQQDERKVFPIISVDEKGEAIDAAYTLGGTKQVETKVVLNYGVPQPGTPEFKKWLRERAKKLNQ